MKKLFLGLIVLALLLAPWLVSALYKKTNQGAELYCEVPYVIHSLKKQSMLLKGNIKVHYYTDGTGIAILTGAMYFREKEDSALKIYMVNRTSSLLYQIKNSYLVTHTEEVHPGYGENLPSKLENEFIFPVFKPNHKDYFQHQSLPNGDIIVSSAGMPRLYCHTR